MAADKNRLNNEIMKLKDDGNSNDVTMVPHLTSLILSSNFSSHNLELTANNVAKTLLGKLGRLSTCSHFDHFKQFKILVATGVRLRFK